MSGELISAESFFAEPNLLRYPLLSRDLPPDNDFLVKDGAWWGCQYWLVRDGVPPPRAVDMDLSAVFAAADAGLAHGARLVEIKARLDDRGRVVFPIGAASGLGVDPRFLLYAEAVAEVEGWFYIHDPGGSADAHWLEGRRDAIRVALVPPFRLKGGPISIPAESDAEAA